MNDLRETMQTVSRTKLRDIPPAMADKIRRQVLDKERVRLDIAAFNSAP